MCNQEKRAIKEEWKGCVETNKILDKWCETKINANIVPIDGICVRIGAMRLSLTRFDHQTKKDIPLRRNSLHFVTVVMSG